MREERKISGAKTTRKPRISGTNVLERPGCVKPRMCVVGRFSSTLVPRRFF